MKRNTIDYALAETYGELGQHALSFLKSLEQQQYTRASIWQYKDCLARLGWMMHCLGVSIADLDTAMAVELAARIGPRRGSKTTPAFMVKRFVRSLADQGLCKPAPLLTPKEVFLAELRRDYETYLRVQRGLTESTIFHCWRLADRFLYFRFGDEVANLGAITPDDIVRFLQHLVNRARSPYRDRTPPTHLRNFFRYLFKAGKTSLNLAEGLPNIKRRYGARVPRHLTSDHVEILLDAIRSGGPAKARKRNYAMALLLARLALRAPEVVAVQIDDIDWRAGELVVRGKGQLHDRVPLPPEVGEAIADYLRYERPPSMSRSIFVGIRAPYSPFIDGQILNEILKSAFASTGLKPPSPYVGSHVLRHSLASNLAREGASLEEIGDLLRHRSRASTLIYAKLDIEGLRSVARPWPTAGGVL